MHDVADMKQSNNDQYINNDLYTYTVIKITK